MSETQNTRLSPAEIERLWASDELPESRRGLLAKLKKWLDRRRADPVADLLSGREATPIEATAMKTLVADILGHFRPVREGIAAVELLAALIDRGNRLGLFSLCPPSMPVLVKRPASPFHPKRWPSLSLAPKLRVLLATAVELGKPQTHDDTSAALIELGRLLLSAILHGGLIAKPLLEALLTSMGARRPILARLGARVHVELSIGYRGVADAEFRRWYPDPLTALLLMRFDQEKLARLCSTPNASSNKLIERAIRVFLRAHGFEDAGISLTRLLDAVRLDLETRIPIYLVGYAARDLVSHSLKPHVLRRLHGKRTETIPAPGLAQAEEGAAADYARDTEPEEGLEPRWWQKLRPLLRLEDRARIQSEIQTLLVEGNDPDFASGSAGERFASFARHLVSQRGDRKRALSTVRGLLSLLAHRLGGLLGVDVTQYGAAEWAALYEEVLADAENPGQRRKLVAALRVFQEFQKECFAIEPEDGGRLFAYERGLVPVDANLVSEAEFLAIRERFADPMRPEYRVFAHEAGAERMSEIAWLMLTLAYRCGLRRMEVTMLTLDDVHLVGRAELLVRPNELRRLKTKNSTRKLPLYALLTDDEQKRLCAWWQKRSMEEKAQPFAPFLFAVPQRNLPYPSPDVSFEILHRAMREVTGDETLHFHHLRHSFASRLHLLLSASAGGWASRLPEFLPQYIDPDQADSMRQRLLGSRQPTRKDVWAVSSLLGHSTPDISIEHYLHHLDIALANELAQPGMAPAKRTVVAASGKSVAQAYRDLQTRSLDAWIAEIHARFYPPEANRRRGRPRKQEKKGPGSALDSLTKLYHALFQIVAQGISPEKIALSADIPLDRLEAYLEAAEWIFALRISEHGAFRHRALKWTPDERRPEDVRRVPLPFRPREARDLEFVERLGQGLRALYRRDKALVERVLRNYVEQARPDFNGLVFMDSDRPQAARDFLAFLKGVGCQAREIRYVVFDVTSKRSQVAASWREKLRLHSSAKVIKRAPLNGRKDWACPWLGIQFVPADGRSKATYALPFALLMAAIAMRLQ
jgi:integrase